MAYGIKYIIRFKNRIQNDVYRCEIWEKDFAGDDSELTGAEQPFTAAYTSGDIDILTPIKTLELTLSFLTDGSITIEDFYSDDDERFRIDFYLDSGGGVFEKFLHSGYLIQDGISEAITDTKHVITLKATDNLALLKNVKWNEVDIPVDFNNKLSLIFFIQYSLKATGLYSPDTSIDMSLPLRIYDNLFENTTDDRSDNIEADPFQETVLDANLFQDTDNTWKDCYEVLTMILTAFNACLLQADGYWNIIRVPEYRLFTDGAIPGVEYIYPSTVNAITLAPLVNIARTGGDCYPIEEDQTKSIQRPLKYVQDTFHFNQPASFIKQSDLQMPDGATPYDTNTVGDLRYDDYDIPTYFPEWVQRGTVTSYLEVVTDTVRDVETDRYIVIIGDDSLTGGIQFNPIEVTKEDKFDFNLQWRTDTDTDALIRFWVRFVLITTDSQTYNLVDTAGGSSNEFKWVGPFAATVWDENLGIYKELTNPTDVDTTEWQAWALSESQFSTQPIPLIPADGVLLVEVRGTDAGSETGRQNTYFKDIRLDFTQYINQSTQIIGQTHTDTGNSLIKAVEENDIDIDDSPRNTISGTLFTNALTNFDFTDVSTGNDTLIGDRDFTKTRLWHRAELLEALRLGNIITQERLLLKYTSRLIVEGTFRNIRYDTDKFISLLCLFQIEWLTGKSLSAASLTIDYMNCSYNTRLIEIFNADDIVAQSVFLYGVKVEEDNIVTGMIDFDTINYFNNADIYLTPSISNSRFTYNGFDTTLDISVIFFVPISGSGTATFTILKNGGVIATQTVDASEAFKRIDFLIPAEAVTDGDYFEAAVDTGGADVDIQSGSINLTVNGVVSFGDQYKFKFLYKTD